MMMLARSYQSFIQRGGVLATLLVCLSFLASTDAAPLADTKEYLTTAGLSDATIIGVLSVATCFCLVVTVFGCAWCCKTGFAKFEETTTETTDHQTYTSFDDFSPPVMSTPSRRPGTTEPEVVTIEPLPQLPGRTSNQWVNVMRAGGGRDLDPSQTVQSIKLIDSPRFQFPRSQISYVDEMGNGWFGKVLQGEAQRMHPGLRKTRVVIKQLRDTATPEEQLLFLQEVQPYREVNHPNVLLLLGQCIDSMPLLLILEYAPFGDLKSYLRKHGNDIQQMAHQDIQLKMAADMISGLMWLHQADFIYIDLATRNCQVCADTSVKIGDYGLALEKYPDDYYINKDNSQAIPIRWLGPEVIDLPDDGTVKTKRITKESNVWSFGIMMLELSTGAKRPYAKLTDEQVLQQVVKEQEIRVDKPALNIHYASRWFEIMMFCWLEADIRPTMKELNDLITYLKSNRDRIDMPDFEARWNNLKPAALQESSESGKEEEGPSPVIEKKPPGSGFDNDFVKPEQAPSQHETPVLQPPSKHDSPAKMQSGFDSDFSKAPIDSLQAVPESPVTGPSPNRNMNAETSSPYKQPLFDDDFGKAAVHPTVGYTQSVPSNPPTEKFESDFVTQSEVPPTQSTPLALDNNLNASPNEAPKELEPNFVQSFVENTRALPDTPQLEKDKYDVPPSTQMELDSQRTSTPVLDDKFQTSPNISSVTVPEDNNPNSFISTSSLTFNRTPGSKDVSVSLQPVSSPDNQEQTQYFSCDTANTTPSANYVSANDDPNTTFDSVISSQSEEPTFVVSSDTSPVKIQPSDELGNLLSKDHSPTEFTSFVMADISLLPTTEGSNEVVPLADSSPGRFKTDSGVEIDGSLVVEPPGDESIAQSRLFEFTDSVTATPRQHSEDTSGLSLYTSSTNMQQTANSPLGITISMQGADPSLEGALSFQTEAGNVSTTRTIMSSGSSSIQTVKTTRTVCQVAGQEIVMIGGIETPEGAVSMVPVSDEEGTRIQMLSGEEVQQTLNTRQVLSSSEQLAAFGILPDTIDSDDKALTRQTSGGITSSSSVTRQMKSQEIASVTTKKSVIRESSGEDLSSVMRQFSSSSSSSSLKTTSNREIVTSTQIIGESSAFQDAASDLPTGEMTFVIAGNNADVSHSENSQSLERSEASLDVMSSADQSGEGQNSFTASKSQQQSSSVQFITQTSSDSLQPVTFDISNVSPTRPTLSLMAEGDPNTTVEKTMTVTSGPGQMSIGQAITMQGGGSGVREMENGAQVSVLWQGSTSMKQEQSVFTTGVTSDAPTELLLDQPSHLAITSPEGDSLPGEN